MPISIAYNNNTAFKCTLRPVPFISINTAINKTGAGETIGVTYSITLTGTLLSDRGSPFGMDTRSGLPFPVDDPDSISLTPYVPTVGLSSPGSAGRYGPYDLFYSGSNYGTVGPPPQVVDADECLDSILTKQRALTALFTRDGQEMEVTPVHGDSTTFYCNPRVLSISFQEGNFVNRCDYTIELEADTLRDKNGLVANEGLVLHIKDGGLAGGVLEGSTVYAGATEAAYVAAGEYFIQDFSEEWSLDTDESSSQTVGNTLVPRTYSISHTVSAVGKTHYLPNGEKLRAWYQAKGFVQNRLMVIEDGSIYNYPNSSNTAVSNNGKITTATNARPSVIGGLIGQGTLDLIAQYGGFNRIMTETIDEAGGSYSVSETWLLASGTSYENYNINISKSNDSVNTEVSIDGTIKGLSSINPAGYGGVNTRLGSVAKAGVDRTGVDVDDRDFHYADSSYGGSTSAITNATSKYYDVSDSGLLGYKSQIYKRANNTSSSDTSVFRRLNPMPLSQSIAMNDTDGTISYNVSYNTRPINILSNVLYENFSINDTYPGDVFATIPVIGRKTGPILQYIGGRTEYKRDLSIEVLVDRNENWGDPNFNTVAISGHQRNFLGAGYLAHSSGSLLPQKPSIMEPNRTELQQLIMEISPMNEPGIRKYFIAPPTESWDPKEGKYSLNLQWTYELEN